MSERDPVDQIAAALAEASKHLRNPERNRCVTVKHKTGGQHSYTYATLDAIFEAVRPALADSGIAIVQPLVYRDGKPYLVTRLVHSSGQSIEHELPIIIDPANEKMNQTQAFGSALTYARRYGIETLLPISAEYDDDGQEAGGSETVAAPSCPKCGKADRVIRSKFDPLAWYCLADKAAFTIEAPAPVETKDDDAPTHDPQMQAATAKASGDRIPCPECGKLVPPSKFPKPGASHFCLSCKKGFGK
jgi:hypothetical protein